MKDYDSIICNSEEEIVECAKYLIKKGYTIANYYEDIEQFKNDVSFIGEWKGLTKLGYKEWIRFYPQENNDKRKMINFNILIRKKKLEKIENYGKLE